MLFVRNELLIREVKIRDTIATPEKVDLAKQQIPGNDDAEPS
jgi:hypothetical protein